MPERKTIIKKTAKRKKAIELPEVMTKIYQPNRITNAQLPLTLIQSKVFAYVMLQLQEAIKADMGNKSYQQLDLFLNPNLVKIKIPLSEISTRASSYRDVKQSIRDLAAVVVSVPYKDETGKGMQRITGLLRADVPDHATYNSTIDVEIERKVADVLIRIDKNDDNIPINFTSYYYETVLSARSVYTPRLYPLIASWAKKGAFTIGMDELKNILSIPDKYPRFYDFKKNVLEPVQNDIFEKAHCWFNCNVADFKTAHKGKIMLNFKVITPEFKKELEKRDHQILNILQTHYKFNTDQIKVIQDILTSDDINRGAFLQKISEVDEHIHKNNADHEKDEIVNKTQYMFKSLTQQFG